MKKAIRRKTRLPATVHPRPTSSPALDGFAKAANIPIVGLGASAGGLEALESFLKNVPHESGIAFVVVQHLDPTHKGIMVELLQRSTTMPVAQVTDRLKVEPGHVYLIPPNRDLSVLHGVLHLVEPQAPRGLRLPIDFFLRSLADDQQERSIGVILSGMGSDGTLGLRAIKEKAGAAFVQDPASAKFDGMPRSAINSGMADAVAPVEQLPAKIIAYLRHEPLLDRMDRANADQDQSALEQIIILLRMQTGHDFSLYKKSSLYRRFERRMGLHQLGKIADYVRYLRANSQEADLLFRELLIGVTRFFRDPPVWEELRKQVLPKLLAQRSNGGVLRAWTPACSTGEEAYSLAIVFKEALDRIKSVQNYTLQIFATDLDKEAIEKARAGVYPMNIAADVTPERLHRFFVQEERGYRVSKEIREMVIFAPHNLVMDPPFTKLDLLTCRNLLIYLSTELQNKLLPVFHFSLNPGGILLLGSAESIGKATDLFAPLPGKTRFFRRLQRLPAPDQANVSELFSRTRTPGKKAGAVLPDELPAAANLREVVERLLVRLTNSAAVLVSNKGEILFIHGKTGKYLEPAAGKANLNLFAMARDRLGASLLTAFRTALAEPSAVHLKNQRVGIAGNQHFVDVAIQRLDEPVALRGTVLVAFTEVRPADKATGKPDRSAAQASEFSALTLELQCTREEAQTAQEELKSANEELQSINEELQSTNEELVTSKEEMQSMNEELQTVNTELQAKVNELSKAGDDMKNLLNSTDIATLFLDDALLVRRFTPATAKIIPLLKGDAGRPITDIASKLDYAELADDARKVQQTLAPQEKSVVTTDGRWFTVRIIPYRTVDNRIDGVVITFWDVSAAKKLEADLRGTETRLRELLATQEATGTPP